MRGALHGNYCADRFSVVYVPNEGSPGGRRSIRIACRECSVVNDLYFAGRPMPIEAASKKFKERGWTVGANKGRDLCPTHSQRRIHEEKTAMATQIPSSGSLTNLARDVIDRNKAEAPREPTFDERRLIFARLNEVYLEPSTGYSAGHTDATIAKELNYPRAWVEKVRSENFGPVKDNEDTKRFLAELDGIRAAFNGADLNVNAMKATLDNIRKRLHEMEISAAAIKKALGL